MGKPIRFSLTSIFLMMLPVAVGAWAFAPHAGFARGDSLAYGLVIAVPCLVVPVLTGLLGYGRRGLYAGLIVAGLVGIGWICLLTIVELLSRR
jgi:hypothetical protein